MGRGGLVDTAAIRSRYGRAAGLLLADVKRHAPLETGSVFGSRGYPPEELADVTPAAVASSLGGRSPIYDANLQAGDRVLDLGSGGGLDALLASKRVGEEGLVVGLDVTPEMTLLARRNAQASGATRVQFLNGDVEKLPFADDTFSVVISNCCLNLVNRKRHAIAEAFRVLAPSGALAIVDIMADDGISEAEQESLEHATGQTAKALTLRDYGSVLSAAGFEDRSNSCGQPIVRGMFIGRVHARKPMS